MVDCSGHTVLCGLDTLGFRTLEELVRLGETVVVIAGQASGPLPARACALGALLVEGSYRDEEVLSAAGVARARALVLVEDDDVGNLHATLTAHDLNAGLRVVLRMFNQELGGRIQALFPDCAVLSSSAIAAPAFVAAALHEDWEQRIELAGRTLVLRRGPATAPDVLMPLARHTDGAAELFPSDGEDVLCLVDAGDAPLPRDGSTPRAPRRAHARRMATLLRGVAASAPVRLQYLLAVILALALASVAVFIRFAGLDLIDALYFTVTIITTTGFGDINLLDKNVGLKLYGILLMVLGASALAVLYAVITDVVVGARLARLLGSPPADLHDHVVVCGLGSIGYRVVEQLAAEDVPVAAVELNEACRFLPTVRGMGVPAIIADARLPETLETLHIGRARSLVVATDDDVANLETALAARSLVPEIRIVLRLFDADLARRVEHAFSIRISRSVSALAAPAFAAAALGKEVLAIVPAGARAVVIARVAAGPQAPAGGETVAAVAGAAEGRVLLLTRAGRPEWRPSGDARLEAGDELVVVATRAGLASLRERSASPA